VTLADIAQEPMLSDPLLVEQRVNDRFEEAQQGSRYISALGTSCGHTQNSSEIFEDKNSEGILKIV
jgi:hypothetical protein